MQNETDHAAGQAEIAGLTEALGTFVLRTAATDIPSAAFEAATECIVDTIGCILAGSNSEMREPMTDYLRQAAEPGPHVIAGTGLRASAACAAMINGSFGHALDFDDTL